MCQKSKTIKYEKRIKCYIFNYGIKTFYKIKYNNDEDKIMWYN